MSLGKQRGKVMSRLGEGGGGYRENSGNIERMSDR